MYIIILLVVAAILTPFFLKYVRSQKEKEIKKPVDRGLEIAILSWFHDHPLCKIPASDIITLHDIIKPYLNIKNDTPTEEIKPSIRSVQPEVRRSRRINVRAWDDEGSVKVLDDDNGLEDWEGDPS